MFLFTEEEKNFVEKSQLFYFLLGSMTDKQIIVFRKCLTYICDLSLEERELLFTRIDTVLDETGRKIIT